MNTPLLLASFLAASLMLFGCDRNQDALSANTQNAIDEVQAQAEENRELAAQQLEEQGYFEPDFEAAAETNKLIEEAAEAATGDEKSMLETLSSFNEQIIALGSTYQQALDHFEEVGGYELTGEETGEDFQSQLDALAILQTQGEVLNQFFRGLKSAIILDLTGKGLEYAKAYGVADGFTSGMKIDLAIEMRESDTRFYVAMGEMTEILLDTVGLVTVMEDGSIQFDESIADDVVDRYFEAAGRYSEEVQLQTEIQYKMLED